MFAKNEKIYPAYVSNHNSKSKKQVNFLMIPRGIASKHNGDYYCLNCLHSFRTKNKVESHIKVWENKDFYNVVMAPEDTKILSRYCRTIRWISRFIHSRWAIFNEAQPSWILSQQEWTNLIFNKNGHATSALLYTL